MECCSQCCSTPFPRASDYSNAESEILRYCVYVETDHDTDDDGFADLVKVMVQVPRPAAEGKYKAATIYDPTPYSAGTCEEYAEETYSMYVEAGFDYSRLYQPGEKRIPAGTSSTMEAARFFVKCWGKEQITKKE